MGHACINSFIPGTQILMADGTSKPIEDIIVGDWVWATDPETGRTVRIAKAEDVVQQAWLRLAQGRPRDALALLDAAPQARRIEDSIALAWIGAAAALHLGDDRAGLGAQRSVGRPQPGRRRLLGRVLEDCQGIPDHPVLALEHRHFAGRRMLQQLTSAQQARNDFLKAEIARLDVQIKGIAMLRAGGQWDRHGE